jgi:hypothetical protein
LGRRERAGRSARAAPLAHEGAAAEPTRVPRSAPRRACDAPFQPSELKQLFGFADSPARSEKAVRRTVPFVGLVDSVLVVWFAEGVTTSSLGTPPERPWYPPKKGLCFADVLRAAQGALRGIDVWELPALLERLEKGAEAKKISALRPLDRAA